MAGYPLSRRSVQRSDEELFGYPLHHSESFHPSLLICRTENVITSQQYVWIKQILTDITSRKLLRARDMTIGAPAVTRAMLLLCSSSTHYPTRDQEKARPVKQGVIVNQFTIYKYGDYNYMFTLTYVDMPACNASLAQPDRFFFYSDGKKKGLVTLHQNFLLQNPQNVGIVDW